MRSVRLRFRHGLFALGGKDALELGNNGADNSSARVGKEFFVWGTFGRNGTIDTGTSRDQS